MLTICSEAVVAISRIWSLVRARESSFCVGVGEGLLYRLSVVTDNGVSSGVWTRGEGGVMVPG